MLSKSHNWTFLLHEFFSLLSSLHGFFFRVIFPCMNFVLFFFSTPPITLLMVRPLCSIHVAKTQKQTVNEVICSPLVWLIISIDQWKCEDKLTHTAWFVVLVNISNMRCLLTPVFKFDLADFFSGFYWLTFPSRRFFPIFKLLWLLFQNKKKPT